MRRVQCLLGKHCYYGNIKVKILTKVQPDSTVGVGFWNDDEFITLTVFTSSLTMTPNLDHF